MELINSFIEYMMSNGVIPKNIYEVSECRDKLIHKEDGKKSLYITLEINGEKGFGSFFDCATGINGYWTSSPKKKWSAEERDAWQKERENKIREEKIRKEHLFMKTREEVSDLYTNATTPKSHKYLEDKKINVVDGLRKLNDGRLIIPLVDMSGMLWSAQTITKDGDKFYYPNGKKDGCFFPVGWKPSTGLPDSIVLCEGVATGVSIHEATGRPVLCALDKGNLLSCAQNFRKESPNARIILAADNDQWSIKTPRPINLISVRPKIISGDDPVWDEYRENGWLTNYGLEAANKAGLIVNGFVVYPDFEKNNKNKFTDFNDLAKESGVDAVRDVFDQLEVTINTKEKSRREEDDLEVDQRTNADPIKRLAKAGIVANEIGYEMPFRALGHGNGIYYYYSYIENNLLALSPSAITKNTIWRLSSPDDWREYFFNDRFKTEAKLISDATQVMMRACQIKGGYSPDGKIRGTGAWMDANRVIINTGDRLIVDGETHEYRDVDSAYLYVSANIIKVSNTRLTDSECATFREICESVCWEDPLSGALLAGWIVSSLVCGALKWRTHIWIVGPSGTGKSTLTFEVIEKALKVNVLKSSDTEAKLRETLKHNAMPVLYDETDMNTPSKKTQIMNVLELAKLASDGQSVGKYGQERTTPTFAACFVGTNTVMHSESIQNRIVQLKLNPHHPMNTAENHDLMSKKAEALIDKNFSSRLFKRAVDNLPTLVANEDVFRRASREITNHGRSAQQMGFILAGLYLLESTEKIDYETAIRWIKRQNWDEYIEAKSDTSAVSCVKFIGDCIVPVRTRLSNYNMTIGELILYAAGRHDDDDITQKEAAHTLGHYGIKYLGARIYISNKNQNLGRLLKSCVAWNTNGDSGWSNTIRYFPRARNHDPMVFVKGGAKQRATSIPCDIFTDPMLFDGADINNDIEIKLNKPKAMRDTSDDAEEVTW